MIKSVLFTVTLLLLNLTALYGQQLKSNPDTIKCYGITELKAIAAGLTHGEECDTLLIIANYKIKFKDSIIGTLDNEVLNLNKICIYKQDMLNNAQEDLKSVNLHLKKEIRRNNWTKVGWIATTVFLSGLVTYLIVR